MLTQRRFKGEMWAKVAEEMMVPWRAAEAMHWQLGEHDMARRAGVVPFTLTPSNESTYRGGPSRAHVHAHSHSHAHAQSQAAIARDFAGSGSPHLGQRWVRPSTASAPHNAIRPSSSRRDPMMTPSAPMRGPAMEHGHEGVAPDASPLFSS